MPTGDKTATHPVVREKVQEMLDKEERDFGSVLSTAKTGLTLYSDPLVAKNTSLGRDVQIGEGLSLRFQQGRASVHNGWDRGR